MKKIKMAVKMLAVDIVYGVLLVVCFVYKHFAKHSRTRSR